MNPALSIQNLRKVYPNHLVALKDVHFDVQAGDCFALLGPNGAGKSTTIGIITSLVRKTAGIVKVFGYDLDKEIQKAKSCIGLVPQEFNFNGFEKIIDILMYQAGYYGVPAKQAKMRAEYYLKKLDLWNKRDQIAMRLSGGMKRRLMVARAFMHEPKLLILDEPTAGVDIEIRHSIWAFLADMNQQGTTIILTTHYLEEAENLCKNIAIIDQGSIITNTTIKSLLSQIQTETFIADLKEPLYQVPLHAPFIMRLLDHHSLEIEVEKHQTLNEMFAFLQQNGIEVASMRNKSNRLEALFLRLIQSRQQKL